MADIPEIVWDKDANLQTDGRTSDKCANPAYAYIGRVRDRVEDVVTAQKGANDLYAFITPGIDDYPILNLLEKGINPQKVSFSGFADLIMWPAIYDLSIPPVPVDGIMYPQFVRRVNQGGAQTAHSD